MSWTCQNCGTELEPQFKVCWNCGTDHKGKVDENFAKDSDPDEVSDAPEIPRISCEQCGYQGKVLFSTEQKSGIEWLVAGLLSTFVSQRSWVHFCHKICPSCGSDQQSHRGWSGLISDENESIWDKAFEAEAVRNGKNRRLFYFTMGCILVAILVLWWAL